MNGYSFGEREEQLLQRFADRQPLTLTPQQLAEKWSGITRNEIAFVCQTDISRVNRWFSRGRSYQAASHYYSPNSCTIRYLFRVSRRASRQLD
jgi:hypothetical protein